MGKETKGGGAKKGGQRGTSDESGKRGAKGDRGTGWTGDIWGIQPSAPSTPTLASSATPSSSWMFKSLRTSWPQPCHSPGDPRTSSSFPMPQTVLPYLRVVSWYFPTASNRLVAWDKSSQTLKSFAFQTAVP